MVYGLCFLLSPPLKWVRAPAQLDADKKTFKGLDWRPHRRGEHTYLGLMKVDILSACVSNLARGLTIHNDHTESSRHRTIQAEAIFLRSSRSSSPRNRWA
eukprot:4684103-Pyramimonas_sp.AAC.3